MRRRRGRVWVREQLTHLVKLGSRYGSDRLLAVGQLMLLEELFYRLLRQLHPDHRMAHVSQPGIHTGRGSVRGANCDHRRAGKVLFAGRLKRPTPRFHTTSCPRLSHREGRRSEPPCARQQPYQGCSPASCWKKNLHFNGDAETENERMIHFCLGRHQEMVCFGFFSLIIASFIIILRGKILFFRFKMK